MNDPSFAKEDESLLVLGVRGKNFSPDRYEGRTGDLAHGR